MGKGEELSSADDTDTDDEDMEINKYVEFDVEVGAISDILETAYWGDREDDKDLDSFDSELKKNDIWKCTRFVTKQMLVGVKNIFLVATLLQIHIFNTVPNVGT